MKDYNLVETNNQKMTQTTTLIVKDIIYMSGKMEVKVVTPREWAGYLRRQGIKKSILKSKDKAIITIQLQTKN